MSKRNNGGSKDKTGDNGKVVDMADVKEKLSKVRTIYDDNKIVELAKVKTLDYARCRKQEAESLGIGVGDLDKAVREQRKQSHRDDNALPHWEVEPWQGEVLGAELLDAIRSVFKKYIVLPAGAADALALWVLHAWTFDAGDISPFMVLVSPTKRCGKTSVLIVLLYLTPKSELASNISASAVFRFIEKEHPTLLIDEADSFVKGNEEMRGILNSGHTKTAAYVRRSVEIEGNFETKRFSVWAPKAIATIQSLADTLEDRSVIVQLQRKPPSAKVARLRKRDSDEFAILRRKAARWAEDNFEKLDDPDPKIPEALNDRAADNWRPLIAIADLAGEEWPGRARDAACLLSGEGHDASSLNVELLADIREAFGDAEAIRTVDLVAKLLADKERPWVECNQGKELTQAQLGRLLKPFEIISERVTIPGFDRARGYVRARFEEHWEAYLPGQNTLSDQASPKKASKRPFASAATTSNENQSVHGEVVDASKNDELSNNHRNMDTWTAKTLGDGGKGYSATSGEGHDDPDEEDDDSTSEAASPGSGETSPASPAALAAIRAEVETPTAKNEGDAPLCAHCGKGGALPFAYAGLQADLHPHCRHAWLERQGHKFDMPNFLRRSKAEEPKPEPEGRFLPGTLMTQDDDDFCRSGKFK